MSKKKLSVRTIAMIGVMAALYVVLNTFVSIKVGNIRVTFASLPGIVMAMLFGPVEAVLTAGLGELINQLISYGPSITLPLWLVPPVFRALMVALAAKAFAKKGQPLEEKPALYIGVLVCVAVLTTVLNTAVMAADAMVWGYYSTAYVFGGAVMRFVNGMITAVVVALLSLPVVRRLRKLI